MTLPVFGAPPASGCYYAPVSSGHGFDVHVRDNLTVIYWYTADKDGNPLWLFAQGEPGAELDLYTTQGGTVDDPTQAVEVKVGTIRATGNAFCWILDGVRGGVETVRLV